MRRLLWILPAFVLLAATACSSDQATTPASSTSLSTSTVISTTAVSTTTIAATTTTSSTTTTSTVPTERITIEELVEDDSYVPIAHAGGDLEGPHSTMFAFQQGWDAGAVVLEADVQLTADDVLIVQHDLTTDKTTERAGPVDSLTFDEIAALDNAYWFSPSCWPCQDLDTADYIYRGVRTGEVEPPAGATPDDFRVITFRELVERFPAAAFDVEIKGSADTPEGLERIRRAAGVLADEVIDLGIVDSTIVVSFVDEAVAEYQRLVPDGWTSPGQDTLLAWVLSGASIDGFRVIQVPPFFNGVPVVTPELIELVHEQGLEIWVWPDDASTQENAAFYAELLDMGVDGVIAGRPSELPPVA